MTRSAVSSTAAAPAARNLKLENALLAARSKALELFQVLESKGDWPLVWHCRRLTWPAGAWFLPGLCLGTCVHDLVRNTDRSSMRVTRYITGHPACA